MGMRLSGERAKCLSDGNEIKQRKDLMFIGWERAYCLLDGNAIKRGQGLMFI